MRVELGLPRRRSALGSLQLLVLLGLASRCRTRYADLADRGPRPAALRRTVLRRHFGKVLREVAEPAWPHR